MKPAYQCLPLLSIVLLLGSSTQAESAQAALLSIAKRGCNDTCGDVKIPFPWGYGSGCFLEKWNEIECREVASSHTKVPFLTKLGVEVMKFEVADDKYSPPLVTIRMAAVKACTTNTHHKLISSALDLKGSPYFFSSIHNVFVMEGCSASAALVNELSTSNFTDVGCATICQNNNTAVETNICHGVKCCQSPLLDDIQSYQVHFYRNSLGNEKLDRRNCLLATLMGKDYLDQYAGKLSPSDAAPVTLTWNWTRITPPHYNPNTATCEFGDIDASSWICYCHENHIGSNPYVYHGCLVPQSCQGCPGSCVRDENPEYMYPLPMKPHMDTYSCHSIWTPLDDSETPKLFYAIPAIAAGPLLLVFASRWLYYFSKQRRRAERRVKYFRLMLQRHQSSNNANGIMESTKLFTHKELDKATEHFNDNRVLGEGGQGTVYKGMLTDGRIVAIKKSKQMDETQMEQFINEVVILSQTNHRNVVKLLGCCLETEVPLLVYEYISNGTLHQHIHNPSEDVLLTWEMRLKIAIGSAGGIAYLHSSSSTPIYHRDIKSANILLDEQYGAKVSDFGSSKTIEIDQTHLTTLVQGTMGYLDPEYFESSVFTEKSDVYSFGVVLLELLTSKKPIFRNEEMEQKSLVSEFLFQMQQNNGLPNILDPEVVNDAKEVEISAFADLAKQCLNESGRLRPTMKEVVMTLEMILKFPVQTHTRDGGGTFADQGFDEVVIFDMDDAEFMSRSARVFG